MFLTGEKYVAHQDLEQGMDILCTVLLRRIILFPENLFQKCGKPGNIFQRNKGVQRNTGGFLKVSRGAVKVNPVIRIRPVRTGINVRGMWTDNYSAVGRRKQGGISDVKFSSGFDQKENKMIQSVGTRKFKRRSMPCVASAVQKMKHGDSFLRIVTGYNYE